MHYDDEFYLSKFEIDPEFCDDDDEKIFAAADDDVYKDGYSDDDDSFYLDNPWDEHL